jgi:hypothetical protein
MRARETREWPLRMDRSMDTDRRTRTLAAVVAANFLAVQSLPAIAVLVTSWHGGHAPWNAASISGGRSYPCEGHDCGCRSREGCLEHCCCYPEHRAWRARQAERGSDPVCGARGDHASVSAAERGASIPAAEHRVSFVSALRCAAGKPDSSHFSWTPIELLLPPERRFVLAAPPGNSATDAFLIAADGRDDAPPTPPPRRSSLS